MTGKRAAGVFMSDGKRECEAKYERNFARRACRYGWYQAPEALRLSWSRNIEKVRWLLCRRSFNRSVWARGIASTPVAMRSGQETTDKEDWFDASI